MRQSAPNGGLEGGEFLLQRSIVVQVRVHPAALWRYLTEDTDIDYDALGFWSFPMMCISAPAICRL